MGMLKGRWSLLRGLRVQISTAEDHLLALAWIKICLILHNLIIDIEHGGLEGIDEEFLREGLLADGEEDGVLEDDGDVAAPLVDGVRLSRGQRKRRDLQAALFVAMPELAACR